MIFLLNKHIQIQYQDVPFQHILLELSREQLIHRVGLKLRDKDSLVHFLNTK